MKNKAKNQGNKRILKLLLIAGAISLALSLLAGGVSYAIFTNSLQAQRTIAAYDTLGNRFTSNYLKSGRAEDNVNTIYTSSDEIEASALVTVCNYLQGRQTSPFSENINYRLTARLVKLEGENNYVPVDSDYMESFQGYTISVTDGDSTVTLGGSALTGQISGTLTGGTAELDYFTVVFSRDFVSEDTDPNLYLELEADPQNGLARLHGIFKADLRAGGVASSWAGEFTESGDDQHLPAEYDGYNYVISGSGTGTCTLGWDASYVAISYVSLDKLLSITGATQSGNSITFPVDSGVESRYDLQFYKVDIGSDIGWDNMSEYVTFEFH